GALKFLRSAERQVALLITSISGRQRGLGRYGGGSSIGRIDHRETHNLHSVSSGGQLAAIGIFERRVALTGRTNGVAGRVIYVQIKIVGAAGPVDPYVYGIGRIRGVKSRRHIYRQRERIASKGGAGCR